MARGRGTVAWSHFLREPPPAAGAQERGRFALVPLGLPGGWWVAGVQARSLRGMTCCRHTEPSGFLETAQVDGVARGLHGSRRPSSPLCPLRGHPRMALRAGSCALPALPLPHGSAVSSLGRPRSAAPPHPSVGGRGGKDEHQAPHLSFDFRERPRKRDAQPPAAGQSSASLQRCVWGRDGGASPQFSPGGPPNHLPREKRLTS